MKLFSNNLYIPKKSLNEEIALFRDKSNYGKSIKALRSTRGEGWESISEIPGFSTVQVQGFNMFYNSYINRIFDNEKGKIAEYRLMASTPEIADVVEDAVNECTQEDDIGDVFHLNIIDSDLNTNENIVRNIKSEFNNLFRENIVMKDKIWHILWTYFVDGRVFYENVIDTTNPKRGIIDIKRLPSETMDFFYNPLSGEIGGYVQYTCKNPKRPTSIEEARESGKKGELVFFDPHQIGFVDYGIYGKSRYEIIGYLDKARVAFNQLKLLETAVIIMRIVRAPERYVFEIDTGSMPREKAYKFVEKVKSKMNKKQTYNPQTGQLTNEPDVMSMLENFFIPKSGDGRGSSVTTIGGNTNQFSELDDVYYFQKKLYRALKYPASRVSASQEGRDAENLFGGNQTSEISRDEIKWAKFLERHQKKICSCLTDTFIQHMKFKGLKKEYNLNNKKIRVILNPPSKYKEQMEQSFQDSRFSNYQMLADREEFSKYYLIKRYLKWSDEDINDNMECKKKDIKLGLSQENDEL